MFDLYTETQRAEKFASDAASLRTYAGPAETNTFRSGPKRETKKIVLHLEVGWTVHGRKKNKRVEEEKGNLNIWQKNENKLQTEIIRIKIIAQLSTHTPSKRKGEILKMFTLTFKPFPVPQQSGGSVTELEGFTSPINKLK